MIFPPSDMLMAGCGFRNDCLQQQQAGRRIYEKCFWNSKSLEKEVEWRFIPSGWTMTLNTQPETQWSSRTVSCSFWICLCLTTTWSNDAVASKTLWNLISCSFKWGVSSKTLIWDSRCGLRHKHVLGWLSQSQHLNTTENLWTFMFICSLAELDLFFAKNNFCSATCKHGRYMFICHVSGMADKHKLSLKGQEAVISVILQRIEWDVRVYWTLHTDI